MFLDRIFLIRIMKRIPAAIKIALFYMLLLIGYVLFRSDTITGAFRYIHRMFDITAIGAIKSDILLANLIGNREIFVMAVCLSDQLFPGKAL